jgi:hypothetical protein
MWLVHFSSKSSSKASIADAYDEWISATQRNATACEKVVNIAQLHHLEFFKALIFVTGRPHIAQKTAQYDGCLSVHQMVFRLHCFEDVALQVIFQI